MRNGSGTPRTGTHVPARQWGCSPHPPVSLAPAQQPPGPSLQLPPGLMVSLPPPGVGTRWGPLPCCSLASVSLALSFPNCRAVSSLRTSQPAGRGWGLGTQPRACEYTNVCVHVRTYVCEREDVCALRTCEHVQVCLHRCVAVCVLGTMNVL